MEDKEMPTQTPNPVYSAREDMEFAHKMVLSGWKVNNTLALGKRTEPTPDADRYTTVAYGSLQEHDGATIRSLPMPPKGTKKSDDRSLIRAMQVVYRRILYNRACFLLRLLEQDDYTSLNPATCQPYSEVGTAVRRSKQSTKGSSIQKPPLLFKNVRIHSGDKRRPPVPNLRFDSRQVYCQGTTGYSPLEKGILTTRLLLLHPGLPGEILRAKLLLTSINGSTIDEQYLGLEDVSGMFEGNERVPDIPQVPFEALSYVWGPSTSNSSMDLSGVGMMKLTDNLNLALQRLRYPKRPRMLWVDALCINQEDLDERAAQVQMMGPIYQSAARVLVWLGDSHAPRQVPVQDYLFCNDYNTSLWSSNNQLIERGPLDRDQDWYTRSLVDAIRSNKGSFWWTRAWILQEFALSSYMPVACFGNVEVPWNEFRLLLETALNNLRGWTGLLDLYGLNDFCGRCKDLMEIRSKGRLGLQMALYLTRKHGATDPRDRIFALQSLIKLEDARTISIDYKKSASEVFVNTTKSFIELYNDLGPLVLVEHNSARINASDSLSTWAIDFTFGDQFLRSSTTQMPTKSPSITNWLNTERPEGAIRFHDTKPLLYATGYLFDAITNLLPLLHAPKARFPGDEFHEYASKAAAFMSRLREENPYEKLVTLGASQEENRKVAWPIAEYLTRRDWSDLAETERNCLYPRNNDTTDVSRALFRIWSLGVGAKRKATYECCRQHFREYLDQWQHYAEFFDSTQSSQLLMSACGFLGMVHGGIEIGDQIVLLFGCNMPVVLRRDLDGVHWTFRGIVFVHGVMEGELSSQRLAQLHNREEFAIR